MNNALNELALKELLYKIADDLLILGHRNSEWTGIGPLLEEDIAFSSMAQDKIGQSLALYEMLHYLGEADPDSVAFMRNSEQFHNCQLVELPIGDYEFSLIRHFLYDHSILLRFQKLSNCHYQPLAQISRKLVGELRYHVMHADMILKKLGNAAGESINRLQTALEQALPFALGIFEKSPQEAKLISDQIFSGEEDLYEIWCQEITRVIEQTSLKLPEFNLSEAKTGGRIGQHTPHLQPLLDEMAEVFRLDPTVDW